MRGMATSPISAYRVAPEEIPFRVNVVTSMPRDADSDDGYSPARGILVGLLLCVPFWVGVVYVMLF